MLSRSLVRLGAGVAASDATRLAPFPPVRSSAQTGPPAAVLCSGASGSLTPPRDCTHAGLPSLALDHAYLDAALLLQGRARSGSPMTMPDCACAGAPIVLRAPPQTGFVMSLCAVASSDALPSVLDLAQPSVSASLRNALHVRLSMAMTNAACSGLVLIPRVLS